MDVGRYHNECHFGANWYEQESIVCKWVGLLTYLLADQNGRGYMERGLRKVT